MNKSVSNNLISFPGKNLASVEQKFDNPQMVACDSKADEIILKNKDSTEEEKLHESTELPKDNQEVIIKKENDKQANLDRIDENKIVKAKKKSRFCVLF
jgi:hypothetical protein